MNSIDGTTSSPTAATRAATARSSASASSCHKVHITRDERNLGLVLTGTGEAVTLRACYAAHNRLAEGPFATDDISAGAVEALTNVASLR